jgi:hypothetical protein
MSSFTSPLKVAVDHEGDSKKPFVVLEAFVFERGELHEGNDRVVVPVGFRTDFASIPPPFRNLFSQIGPWTKAAVVHDYLYNGGWVMQFMEDPESDALYEVHHDPSRAESDSIFLEGMKVLKVAWWKRYPIYLAVRVFGWLAYSKVS